MAGWQRRKPTFDHTKPFAWSYSKLKNFETCPKRHYHVDILREFNDDSEELRFGNAIHDALADAVGNKGGKGAAPVPMPAPYVDYTKGWYEPYLAMRAQGADVATEMDLAINANFQPTGWFDKDAWYRAKIDVRVLHASQMVGIAEDWKTGKPSEDSPQLHMTALVMFAHYPPLQAVQTRFSFLKYDERREERVRRDDSANLWMRIAPRVERLRGAYTNPDPTVGFPAQPGFLCRRYCPVKTCPHHGK